MDRVKARNEVQEQWLTETAEALACAERLAGRLIALRGSSEIGPVLAIQAEIADLRRRVDQLERDELGGSEFHPDWLKSSAWASQHPR